MAPDYVDGGGKPALLPCCRGPRASIITILVGLFFFLGFEIVIFGTESDNIPRYPAGHVISLSSREIFDGNEEDDTASAQSHEAIVTGSCGSIAFDMVIGVLCAPTERSRIARNTIRKTWMTLDSGVSNILVLFILAKNKDGKIPEDLQIESENFNDMVFLNTLDSYKNLAKKVELLFKWVVHTCKGKPLVMKTDEDVFIHLPKLGDAIQDVPKKELYWGRFMRGIPARDDRGRPLPDNHQNFRLWPNYASGAGYILSFDVANAIANPKVPLQGHDAEDVHIGVSLFGYNLTEKEDFRIKPWGSCDNDTFLIHYQRQPEILIRRWKRAVAQQSICGEPFKYGEVCNKAEPEKEATWDCPEGTTIQSVIGATYGRVYGSGSSGSCSEGIEGLEPLLWCHAPNSVQVMEEKCLHQQSCTVRADIKTFGNDPCKGERKHFLGAVRCA
eukprot:m.333221 g.333221  ORF g.333221 m.333221 type:complete len:444 (-) comp17101_c0_seq1:1098-2429(-)